MYRLMQGTKQYIFQVLSIKFKKVISANAIKVVNFSRGVYNERRNWNIITIKIENKF